MAGCGTGATEKVVYGTVTCNGEQVPQGTVRFVPIEGTAGPASTGRITDGEYRIEARGGVPVGKHRVEVMARQPTGRQVEGMDGLVMAMIDELVALGPVEYEGAASPLIVEVLADSDGRVDLELPRNPQGPRKVN